MLSLNSSPSYGGVGILIHKSIQFKEIALASDFDAICIEICSKKTLNIISTYLPPKANFNLSNLNSVLTPANNKPTIITGDFNSWNQCWGSPKNNKKGVIIGKFINQSNFIILNNKSPTHLSTHNTLTHIDLTFCSAELALDAEWDIETNFFGSDHLPIITNLFHPTQTQPPHNRPCFKTHKADWKLFESLSDTFHRAAPRSSNINQEAANVNKIILKSAHLSIPKSAQITSKRVPWWNKELEDLRKSKNNAWHTLKRNISSETIIDFRKKNALFRRTLKVSKRQSISAFTEEINPNTPIQKIWCNIRRFCGLNPTKGIHCLTQNNNHNITHPQEIADLFCHNWSAESQDSKFSNLFYLNKTKTLNTYAFHTPSKKSAPIELDINFIEFSSALDTLKGKTPGLDRISYNMIKALSINVKSRLIDLYNSILQGLIPQQYKLSVIIPVLKPEKNKSDTSSYRPISLNSCMAKLLDKIVARRLWWFVTTYKLIHNSQTGFRRGKSVMDSLLFTDYLINKALSAKNHLSIISLDFCKAFDKVGIHAVINQLVKWNVGPIIVNYVKNFMTNRKIKVKIGRYFSKTLPLHNGIPQGSPLSVVLFVIAYQKLLEIIAIHKEIQISAYADDFNLLIKLDKVKNRTINLDTLYEDISGWCSYSGASLSPAKCKHMHICNKHNCNCSVAFGNYQLPNVSTLKILGVTFNKKHKWNTHIDNLCLALQNRLNIIKCLSSHKHNCSTVTLVSVVKAIIIAKIDFALPLYGNAPKSSLNKISTILNSGVRIALGAYRTTPTRNLLYEANIAPLDLRKEQLTASLYTSILNGTDSPINNIIKNYKTSIIRKKPSVIDRIFSIHSTLHIQLKSPRKLTQKSPPWALNKKAINTSLSYLSKNSTPPEIFRKEFAKIQAEHSKNTTFIYTDGSQINSITGYAVATKDSLIKYGILPPFTTVFSAEIIAIYEAISILKKNRGRYIICSDSLSSLNAIKNISNQSFYANEIRNLLIRLFPKFLLIWIPSHVNINGNEFADFAAKKALKYPLIYTLNNNSCDIKKHIKIHYNLLLANTITNTSMWYQNINPLKINITQYLTRKNHQLSRMEEIKFIRLRLGHTKLTHAYYINPNISTSCPLCSSQPFNLDHILTSCPSTTQAKLTFFTQNSPMLAISQPTPDNIKSISNFLKHLNLFYNI